DPARMWPVFVGRVTRDRKNPATPVYAVDLAGRPYVGLVGADIRAPSGSASVQIGELNGDTRRFAVFVPARWAAGDTAKLAVDRDGAVDVQGDTGIAGDVVGEGRSVVLQPAPEPPVGAVPWRVYHVAANGMHELRIEMARGKPPAGNNQV